MDNFFGGFTIGLVFGCFGMYHAVIHNRPINMPTLIQLQSKCDNNDGVYKITLSNVVCNNGAKFGN